MAEVYCNFGVAGLLVVPSVIGFVLEKMQLWICRCLSPTQVVVFGLSAASTFWWVRNDSMRLLRFLLWGLVLYFALV